MNQSTPDLNRSVPDVEADEPTWATVGEPGVASYAAFNLDMFDLECPRARISPFVSYAEAAAFVRVNFWFNGVDYWDGERWVLDVQGEVLLPGGPAQKQRLRELAAELARADSALRRAALLLGREDLTAEEQGRSGRGSEAKRDGKRGGRRRGPAQSCCWCAAGPIRGRGEEHLHRLSIAYENEPSRKSYRTRWTCARSMESSDE